MSRILAIDLGKFKSVTCLLDSDTNETEFWTMSTDRQYLLAVLKNYHPDLVVIESCSSPDGFTTSAPRKATRCWSAIPTRRPGSGNISNARRTATMRSSWPSWPRWISWSPCTFRADRQREYRRLVKYRTSGPGTDQSACRTTSAPSLHNGGSRWCVVRRRGRWNDWSRLLNTVNRSADCSTGRTVAWRVGSGADPAGASPSTPARESTSSFTS